MYLRQEASGSPAVVKAPSPTSGLYIRTRGGTLTKVSIPEDCLAFQTGEALELATAGKLRATPHCVRVGGARGRTLRGDVEDDTRGALGRVSDEEEGIDDGGVEGDAGRWGSDFRSARAKPRCAELL